MVVWWWWGVTAASTWTSAWSCLPSDGGGAGQQRPTDSDSNNPGSGLVLSARCSWNAFGEEQLCMVGCRCADCNLMMEGQGRTGCYVFMNI